MSSGLASVEVGAAPGGAARPLLAAAALAKREWVRFVRQPNRVAGAILQPVLFWILFGAGLGPTFRLPDDAASSISYRDYFFPGTAALIVLFTAIFTTISVIEDRREGFLQSVLVAPLARWAMVLGKLSGGSLIAAAQALLFVALGLALGVRPTPLGFAATALFLLLVALGQTGLGFVLAWRMDSTQGFHAVMSLLLFPMWLLSGAFFPARAGPLYWVMWINPLSYGVAGLRRLLFAEQSLPLEGLPGMGTCWLATGLFAAAMFAWSCRVAALRTTGDLL